MKHLRLFMTWLRSKIELSKRKVIGVLVGAMLVAAPTAAVMLDASPAGATFDGPYNTTIANPNSCQFHTWFDQAVTTNPVWVAAQWSSVPQQANGCVYEFQYKVLCGVYGVPGTYYWHVGVYFLGWISQGATVPSGFPELMFPTSPYDACPIWGNDMILDVEIVIKAYNGGQMMAWSVNNKQWLSLCLNGSGVRCNFEANDITYWKG